MKYNKLTKEARFTTQDGIEVVLSCPTVHTLLNIRDLIDEEYLDDAESMASFFCCLCITKFGDKDSLSFEEYMDLSMRDGMLITKCIKFFIPGSKDFNVWGNVLTEKGIKELRKLLLLSVENNVSDFFNLLDRNTYDVVTTLEAWYQIKLEEYEQTTGKPHPSVKKKGMSGLDLVKMGADPDRLLAAIRGQESNA